MKHIINFQFFRFLDWSLKQILFFHWSITKVLYCYSFLWLLDWDCPPSQTKTSLGLVQKLETLLDLKPENIFVWGVLDWSKKIGKCDCFLCIRSKPKANSCCLYWSKEGHAQHDPDISKDSFPAKRALLSDVCCEPLGTGTVLSCRFEIVLRLHCGHVFVVLRCVVL